MCKHGGPAAYRSNFIYRNRKQVGFGPQATPFADLSPGAVDSMDDGGDKQTDVRSEDDQASKPTRLNSYAEVSCKALEATN